MTITAIYCPETKEILFSRSQHDFRQSSDGKYFIDGGFDYTRIGGNPIIVYLNGEHILKYIFDADYRFKNINAKEFPMGYQGRFLITDRSNVDFYKKLIVNFEDVEDLMFPKEA